MSKIIYIQRAVVSVTAMLMMLWVSSCTVKPHSTRASQASNKAIIDLQKPDQTAAADAKSDKRTKVATRDARNGRSRSNGKKTNNGKKNDAAKTATTASAKAQPAGAAATSAAPAKVSVATAPAPTPASKPISAPAKAEVAAKVDDKPKQVIIEEPARPQASQQAVQVSQQVNSGRPAEYRLGYGDVVEIKFFYTPEYNETVTIRPDGYISLQRVGDIYVAGKTASELDQYITATYGEILQRPDVTVLVRQFGGQQCYVMGEVEKPGTIDVAKGMTMMRAIAAAGGPKKSAKMSSVILIRSADLKKAEASRIDLSFGHLAKKMESDLPITAFDVIYVPKTFVADVGAFMSQIYDIVIPPFDAWARYEYWYKH
jgi:protein involved in polysaccharide export with SLBB domain